jgi:hypothetical protein
MARALAISGQELKAHLMKGNIGKVLLERFTSSRIDAILIVNAHRPERLTSRNRWIDRNRHCGPLCLCPSAA